MLRTMIKEVDDCAQIDDSSQTWNSSPHRASMFKLYKICCTLSAVITILKTILNSYSSFSCIFWRNNFEVIFNIIGEIGNSPAVYKSQLNVYQLVSSEHMYKISSKSDIKQFSSLSQPESKSVINITVATVVFLFFPS